MFMTKRQNYILDRLKNNGNVLVDELVNEFSVTPQTIRTDLNELSKANKLIRVHGGARLIDGRVNVSIY
jgi:DeoR family glycerol-3-phosphate regulon repressor